VSRNAKAAALKADPVGKAFLDDYDNRLKKRGYDRAERRRLKRALTRGEMTPEDSLRKIRAEGILTEDA
jgi:hypothetical protein